MRARVWDASAAIKLIVQEPGSTRARDIYAAPLRDVVPDWTSMEIASTLCKRAMRHETSADSALDALATWECLAFETSIAGELAHAAMRLALKHRHATYDCLYLALAMAEDAVLVTADVKQREVAEAAGVEVLWIDSSP